MAFTPTPHSTTPGPQLQPGASPTRPGMPQLTGPAQVNQQNVTVKRADDMLNLVNSLAARQEIASGQRTMQEGSRMMATPRQSGDTWRSKLGGVMRSYRGERKIDQGIAQDEQYKAEKMKQLEEYARAQAQVVLNQTGDQAQADMVYKAIMAGQDPQLQGPDNLSRKELFEMRDKIMDDAKKDMEFIKGGNERLDQLNLIINEGYESGAAQIASLYALIKDLDPGSVVREGEVALAQQAESILGSIEKIFIKANDAGVMSPDMFHDLVSFTQKLNEIQRKSARKGMAQHVERAKAEGFEPEEIWGQTFADWWSSDDVPMQAVVTPTEAGVPVYNSPDEVRAAVAEGRLKSGDTFKDAEGKTRKVP
jgi:hypothetical protein